MSIPVLLIFKIDCLSCSVVYVDRVDVARSKLHAWYQGQGTYEQYVILSSPKTNVSEVQITCSLVAEKRSRHPS